MAPKKPRAKPVPKVRKEAEIMSEPRHNMVAFLDPKNIYESDFGGIMEYLRRSRIRHAVSHAPKVYKTMIKEFWDSASVQTVDNEEVIQGTVSGQLVNISEGIIRTELKFGDNASDPTSVPIHCQHGCLLRMKCNGDILAGQINKMLFPLQYKFLLHVLIQCLGSRKSGYDIANTQMLGLMTALTLNKPFNISRFIFENMKDNLGKRMGGAKKFWMYPRFVQIIIDSQFPDLPKDQNDELEVDVMKEIAIVIFKRLSKYIESTPPRKLFGHLGNTNYDAPENDKWRHNESESDDEEPKIAELIAKKKGDAEAGGSKKPKAKTIVVEENDDDKEEEEIDDTVEDEDESDKEDDDEDVSYPKKKGKKASSAKKAKRVSSDELPADDVPVVEQPTETPSAAQHPDAAEILTMLQPDAPTVVQGSSVPIEPVQDEQFPSTTVPSVAEVAQGSSEQPRRKRGAELTNKENIALLIQQFEEILGFSVLQEKFMSDNRNTLIKIQLEMNSMKATIDRQEAEIKRLSDADAAKTIENEKLMAKSEELEKIQLEMNSMKATIDRQEAEIKRLSDADAAKTIENEKLKAESEELEKIVRDFVECAQLKL